MQPRKPGQPHKGWKASARKTKEQPFPIDENGRLDIHAANKFNNPDVEHGGHEEDDQDNDGGA